MLLYHVTRAHAWWNGNKRMALVITMLFLAINDRWWVVGDAAYKLVCYVADETTSREDALTVATGVFSQGMDPLPEDLAKDLAKLRSQRLS